MPQKIVAINRKVSMGSVIRSYRLKAEIGTQQLADMLHVSRGTILHWETDQNRPSVDQIRDLVEYLNIPLNTLFNIKDDFTPTGPEVRIINWYRQASDVGKKIIEHMAETVVTDELDARDRRLTETYKIITDEPTDVAAGTGNPFSQAGRKYRFIRKSELSNYADAIIRVSGRSMEDKYHDGDYVYVKYGVSAHDGDDVVCSTADGAVIKRKMGNKIYSLNKDFPFGEKSEDDFVKIEGVVLGIVDPDDFASKENAVLLEDLLADQIREFERNNPN